MTRQKGCIVQLYNVEDIKKAGSLLVSDIASLYGADAPQNYPTSTKTLPSAENDVNLNSIDTEYFDAIDSGDMDKVRQMVDEAAKVCYLRHFWRVVQLSIALFVKLCY